MILTGGGAIDSALACFYNPSDPSHFRLSLLSFQLDQQGALKTTSLKRQSFMLGQDGNKTAYHRLQDFKKSKLKSIQTINEIFSLERVTKEFFDKISKHFEILSQSITFPQNLSPDEKRQFALRLIARVLFCKFLEKKDILPKEILSSHTTKSNDYYHEVLESLFFLTLNTPQESRNYGLLPDYISSLLQSIPYLNGGLFQPHPQDFFNPANPTIYCNDLKVPSEDIYDFLDTLNQFHFTIDESTPLDEEIGLDPEMLGMVFENLLGSLGKETQNQAKSTKDDQKSTGSYYTPREIVSYMVRSSTLKYLCIHTQIPESTLENLIINKSSVDLNNKPLLTDTQKLSILQALQNFKVLDPACGSGAFPMGILQEICEILEVLDPDAQKFFKLQDAQFQKDNKGKSPSYIRKLAILQNNIYGVDIQPIATEIARLRCFLSLICDEDREHIAPLPNLEFKFVTADTLISIRSDSLEYDGFTQDLQKLESIRQEFFQTTSSKRKDMLKESFQKLRADIGRKITLGGVDNPLPSWDPFDHKQGAEFFDSGYMFGVKSFDLVIGNPPYVRHESITDRKPYLKKNFKVYDGKGDLYTYFFEKGYQALKDNATLSFITSNKWTRTGYGGALRKFLLEHTTLLHYIEFNGVKVFENATVDTSILSFGKVKASADSVFTYAHPKNHDPKSNAPIAINPISIPQSTLSAQSFIFSTSPEIIAIREKIESIGTPLKDWDLSINYGIKTGYNPAFIIDSVKREEILNACKDEDERERTAKLIKPILRGEDIKRYSYKWADQWLINTHNGYKKMIDNQVIKIPPIDIDDYPALKAHLDTYWDEISKRYDKGKTPYNLRGCAYIEDFAKEKIIYRNMASEFIAYLDTKGFFTNQKCFIITQNQTKPDNDRLLYLTAILNSKANFWYFKQIGATLGASGYEMSKIFVERLPIPQNPDSKILAQIEKLASEVMESKKTDSETNALESHLDSLIYTLYGLDDSEISLIESELTDKERERERAELIENLYHLLDEFINTHAPNLDAESITGASQNLVDSQLTAHSKSPKYNGKIIYSEIVRSPQFYLDEQGFFAEATSFVLNGENLHYLLGMLNSKLLSFAFKNFYAGGGLGEKGYRYKKAFLERLPIPKLKRAQEEEFVQIIKEILESKKIEKDTQELESHLDSMIFDLYGLSEAERQIVNTPPPPQSNRAPLA